MTNLFDFALTSSHPHTLRQSEKCESDSLLVMDDDLKDIFRLEMIRKISIPGHFLF